MTDSRYTTAYARIGDLSGPSCRRLLALAWWRFDADWQDSVLHEEVRDALVSGGITPEQIETEWRKQQ